MGEKNYQINYEIEGFIWFRQKFKNIKTEKILSKKNIMKNMTFKHFDWYN